MITLTSIVLSLLQLAASCHNKCCWPDRFEDNVDVLVAERNEETTLISGYGKFSLDSTIQMTNLQIRGLVNEKTADIRVLTDYKTKKQYTINERTQKCLTDRMEKPWPGTCIPDTMKKVYTEYIGAKQNKYFLDVYEGRLGNITSTVKVTVHGCIPVDGALVVPGGMLTNVFYSDFTEGIKDPSVFHIPKNCPPKSQPDESRLMYRQYSPIVAAFMPNVLQ